MLPPAQLSAMAVPEAMMPGAPPVRLASGTVMEGEPLRRNEIGKSLAVSPSVAPAASPLTGYDAPSWVKSPEVRLYSRSCGDPLFQKYMPRYRFWPLFWDRTAGPIHWPPVSCVEVTCTCEYWLLV